MNFNSKGRERSGSETTEMSFRNYIPQISKTAIFVVSFCGLVLASPIPRFNNLTSLSEKTSENRFSKEILQSMNLDINPCEDFYKFACGNYGTHHKGLRFNKADVPTEMFSRNNKLINPDILESLTQFDGAAEKAKDFYTSCTYTYGKGKCFLLTRRYFPDIIGRLFTQSVLTSGKIYKVRQLFEKISSAFREKILRWDWLDSEGKQSVINRLLKTNFFIGATSSMLNVTQEKDVYKNLSVSKDRFEYFHKNLWAMEKFESTRVWPAWLNNDLSEWNTIFDVGAIYNPFEDFIFVPVGKLQELFFVEDGPDVLQYSKLGFVLAHEYAHAFVTHLKAVLSIAEVSGHGQPDIMQSSFMGSLQCLMDMNYTLPNSNFSWSGKTCFEEDWSDILGIQIAFETFQKSYKSKKNFQRLLGLERFTMDQVYFISAAQYWCAAYASEEIERLDLQGNIDEEHSPPQFRVLIEMSNSMNFAQAFSCPVGSNYNPEKICGNYFRQ